MARRAYASVWSRELKRGFDAELAFYRKIVNPGDLCFDVGANYGEKSEVFLQLGAAVVAFEPQARCLQEAVERCRHTGRMVAVNVAVSSSEGSATLYLGEHATKASLLPDWQEHVLSEVSIPTITLDAAIDRYGVPDHCKIDVEGHEIEVLRGLTRPIKSMSFEYHIRRDGVERALECLAYLNGLAPVSVNVAPAETPRFAGTKWWGFGEFCEFFRCVIPQLDGYEYGDVFVRI